MCAGRVILLRMTEVGGKAVASPTEAEEHLVHLYELQRGVTKHRNENGLDQHMM